MYALFFEPDACISIQAKSPLTPIAETLVNWQRRCIGRYIPVGNWGIGPFMEIGELVSWMAKIAWRFFECYKQQKGGKFTGAVYLVYYPIQISWA